MNLNVSLSYIPNDVNQFMIDLNINNNNKKPSREGTSYTQIAKVNNKSETNLKNDSRFASS